MGRPRGSKNKVQRSLEERFWEKVDIRSNDECWNWVACVHPSGYGQFNINRKMFGSHRIAWELVNGKIPDGMCICHHCDNRICCNPKHLFLGTMEDNSHDRDNKGRAKIPDNRGENHGLSRLTVSDVIEMRKLFAWEGYTYLELSKKFGITKSTAREIIKRRKWSWLK